MHSAHCTLLRYVMNIITICGFHHRVTPDTDSISGVIREVVRAMIVVSLT